jgi:hypothetical protein
VKGAPDTLLPRCVAWRRPAGEVTLSRRRRQALEAHVQDLGARGYRVLAIAQRPATGRHGLGDDRVRDLVLLGILALADCVSGSGWPPCLRECLGDTVGAGTFGDRGVDGGAEVLGGEAFVVEPDAGVGVLDASVDFELVAAEGHGAHRDAGRERLLGDALAAVGDDARGAGDDWRVREEARHPSEPSLEACGGAAHAAAPASAHRPRRRQPNARDIAANTRPAASAFVRSNAGPGSSAAGEVSEHVVEQQLLVHGAARGVHLGSELGVPARLHSVDAQHG